MFYIKGGNFMKKIVTLIIISTMIFTLVGCQSKSEGKETVSNEVSIKNNENTLNVKIIANGDSTTFSGMPINLTSKLTGEYDKDIQYHWILENNGHDKQFEGFVAPESGPLKEIVNSGEPVELGLFAEVSWVEGTVIEFKVKLQVEEKDSSNIITTDEITIENREGIYKIK